MPHNPLVLGSNPSSPRHGICIYCGTYGPITGDHVPPKCLFAKPWPELFTVPSCRQCNQGASLDDEYFRTVLNFHDKAGDHSDAKRIRESVMRSLHRQESAGFRTSFLGSVRTIPVRSVSSLYLGERLAFDVDLSRLDRVVSRVVRGFYFKETGKYLPPEFSATVYSEAGLRRVDSATADNLRRHLIKPALDSPLRTIGNSVLDYRAAFLSDREHVSAWILRFYKKIYFFGITHP